MCNDQKLFDTGGGAAAARIAFVMRRRRPNIQHRSRRKKASHFFWINYNYRWNSTHMQRNVVVNNNTHTHEKIYDRRGRIMLISARSHFLRQRFNHDWLGYVCSAVCAADVARRSIVKLRTQILNWVSGARFVCWRQLLARSKKRCVGILFCLSVWRTLRRRCLPAIPVVLNKIYVE